MMYMMCMCMNYESYTIMTSILIKKDNNSDIDKEKSNENGYENSKFQIVSLSQMQSFS